MSTLDARQVTMVPAGRPWLTPQAAFVVCVAFLVAAALLVHVGAPALKLHLTKGAVPLRKPLHHLDKSQLGAYTLREAIIMEEAVVNALGTRDYISWVLEDQRRPENDPLRYPMLFVSYYTGGGEQVPHTAERCYLGTNFQALDPSSAQFQIPNPDGGEPVSVPVTVQPFRRSSMRGTEARTVVYTFYANCGFTEDRNMVRLWLADPRVPKAFFSKVEVTFAGGQIGFASPDPQQATAAAEALLQTVLPVLVREHWPRWEDLTGSAENESSE